MAQIPTYQSKKEFQSGGSIFAGSAQDLTAARSVSSVEGETAKKVGTFAEKMQKVKDFAEYNDAITGSKQALATIQMNAEQDPNMDNHQEYIDQMQDIRDEVMSSLSPHLQQKYAMNYDSAASVAGVAVQKSFWKKRVDAGNTALFNGLNAIGDSIMSEDDPAQIKLLKRDKMNLLNEAVSSGFITQLEAAKMEESTSQEWAEKKAMMLLRDDAEAGLDVLTSGKIEDLTPDARSKLIDLGLKMKTKQQKEQENLIEAAQTKAETELGAAVTRGEKDIVDMVQAFNDKLISAEYANDIFEYALTNHEYMMTEKEVWNKFLDKALDPEENLKKFEESTIQMKGVSDEDRDFFRSWIQDGYNYAIKEKSKLKEPKWKFFKDMWEGMKSWTNRFSSPADREDDLYEMGSTLLGMVEKGLPADEVQAKGRELINEMIKKKYPSTAQIEDVPHVVASAGNYEAVSDVSKAKADRTYKRPEVKPEYSEEDIRFTAEKNGMSVEEVKKRLGVEDAD